MLPNGWFGRPYDNIHQLTGLLEEEDVLSLSFDGGQLILNFEGIPQIAAAHDELVFTDFRSLQFDWKEYGSNTLHTDCFDSGVVKIVAPPRFLAAPPTTMIHPRCKEDQGEISPTRSGAGA